MALTNDQVEAIQQAKGSWWKKALWIAGGLGLLVGGVVLVIALLRRRNPIEQASSIVGRVQDRVTAIDAKAKAEAAAAAGVEASVVREIERIASLPDEYERAKRLAELAAEDLR